MSLYTPAQIQRAFLSSSPSPLYPASNVIDDDTDTIAATRKREGNWMALQLSQVTAIQYVQLTNRVDLAGSWPAQLGTFEVWVGSAPGDTSSLSAVMCGAAKYHDLWNHLRQSHYSGHPEDKERGVDKEPYMIDCNGANGQFVTVKQTGASRWFVVAELKVYA
jgi:hypothetical protein